MYKLYIIYISSYMVIYWIWPYISIYNHICIYKTIYIYIKSLYMIMYDHIYLDMSIYHHILSDKTIYKCVMKYRKFFIHMKIYSYTWQYMTTQKEILQHISTKFFELDFKYTWFIYYYFWSKLWQNLYHKSSNVFWTLWFQTNCWTHPRKNDSYILIYSYICL